VCSTEDDQEGVMDNLLEALKTGSAFNVNRERKEGRRRAPRAAGGVLIWIILSQIVMKCILRWLNWQCMRGETAVEAFGLRWQCAWDHTRWHQVVETAAVLYEWQVT